MRNQHDFPLTAVLDHPQENTKYASVTSERYGVAEWSTLIVVNQQGMVVAPVPLKRLSQTITDLLDQPIDE